MGLTERQRRGTISASQAPAEFLVKARYIGSRPEPRKFDVDLVQCLAWTGSKGYPDTGRRIGTVTVPDLSAEDSAFFVSEMISPTFS